MNPIIQEEFVSYTNPITYIVIPSQQGQILPSKLIKNHILKVHNQQRSKKSQQILCNDRKISVDKQARHHIFQNAMESTQIQRENMSTQLSKQGRKLLTKKEQVQKYGRNICSNIFHTIIKKILYEKQYNEVLLKIISNYNMQITSDEFYSKLYFKQNKLNEYVSFDKIKEFYFGKKNRMKEGVQKHHEFCRILRIMSKLYLQNEHATVALDCPKLKRESKHFHLKESRKMYSIVNGTFKKDNSS